MLCVRRGSRGETETPASGTKTGVLNGLPGGADRIRTAGSALVRAIAADFSNFAFSAGGHRPGSLVRVL